jgi:tetratricopeptide (TPR) repeat protein
MLKYLGIGRTAGPSAGGSSEATEALRGAGDLARDRRDWAAAEAGYAAYLAAQPDDADIWMQLGHALKEQGNRSGAEAAYRKSLALKPDDADAHLQLGHLHKLNGNPALAAFYYREAVERDPGLRDAREELAALNQDWPAYSARPDAILAPAQERIDALQRRVAQLESVLDIAGRQFTTLLDQLSTTRALNFEVLRQGQRLDRVSSRLDEVSDLVSACQAQLAIAASPTDVRNLRNDLDAITVDFGAASRQMQEIAAVLPEARDLIEANRSRLDSHDKELGRMGQAVSATRTQYEALLKAVAALTARMPELVAEMGRRQPELGAERVGAGAPDGEDAAITMRSR